MPHHLRVGIHVLINFYQLSNTGNSMNSLIFLFHFSFEFFPTTYELPVSKSLNFSNVIFFILLIHIHIIYVYDSTLKAVIIKPHVCYLFKSEYHIFVEEFKKNPGIIWIMKPAARAQGRGIFLFRRLKDITDWKKVSRCLCSRIWLHFIQKYFSMN